MVKAQNVKGQTQMEQTVVHIIKMETVIVTTQPETVIQKMAE